MCEEEKEQLTAAKEMLDTAEAEEIHRKSWQSKYQSICEEYTTRVEDTQKPEDGPPNTNNKLEKPDNNPLTGLVGQYDTDSDSDGATAGPSAPPPKKKLNEELTFFLQEIQTLAKEDEAKESAPASTPNENACASISRTEETLPPPTSDIQLYEEAPYIEAPPTPWQECYDENSGYVYYWNVETNEVSWEMPAAYQYYFVQQQQWMQRNQIPMIGLPPEYRIPHMMQSPAVIEAPAMLRRPMLPRKHPMMDLPKKHAKKRKKKKTSKSKHIGSDEEKIEMITSYGPAVEEESDENDREKKRKKRNHATRVSGLQFPQAPIMGPQLQAKPPKFPHKDKHNLNNKNHPLSISACIANLQQEQQHTHERSTFETTSNLVNNHPDLRPPGVEESDTVLLQAVTKPKNISVSENEGQRTKSVLSTISTSLEDKEISNNKPEKQSNETKDETCADFCNKLDMSKSSGAEIPEGTKPVIECQMEGTAVRNTHSPCNELESNSVTEGIQKTVSFALIAGYGEDSDVEEDEEGKKKMGEDEEGMEGSKEEESEKKAEKGKEKEKLMVKEKLKEDDMVQEESSSENALQDETGESKELAVGQQSSSENMTDSSPTISHPVAANTLLETLSSNHENETDQVKSFVPNSSAETNTSASAVRTDVEMRKVTSSRGNSERRGLGFSLNESNDADANKSDFIVPVKRKSQKQGNMIQFIKAATLTPSSDTQDVDNTPEETTEKTSKGILAASSHLQDSDNIADEVAVHEIPTGTLKPSSQMEDVDNTAEGVADKMTVEEEKEGSGITDQISEMTGMIMEKVSFLAEGKPSISAVQAIGIQVQTLLTAWQHGSLYENYFQQWLVDTMEELSRLEQGAAPVGWQCLWSRGWKRYYYCNIETGEVQWEYPYASDGDLMEEDSVNSNEELGESFHVQSSTQQNKNGDKQQESPCKSQKKKKKKKRSLQHNSVPKAFDECHKGETEAQHNLTVDVPSDILSSPNPASSPVPTADPTVQEQSLPDESPSSSEEKGRKQPLPPGVDHPELPYLISAPPPPPPPLPAMPPPLPPSSPPPSSPPPPPTSPPPHPASPQPPAPHSPPPHSPPPLLSQPHLAATQPSEFPDPALALTPTAPTSSPHPLAPPQHMHLAPQPHMIHGPYLPAHMSHTMPMYEPPSEEYTDIDGEEMTEDNESHSTSAMMPHPDLYMSDGSYLHNVGIPPGGPMLEYGQFPYPMNPMIPPGHVIMRPPEKTSLHAEIDSFYSDLASIEQTGGISGQGPNHAPQFPVPEVNSEMEVMRAGSTSLHLNNVNDNPGVAANQNLPSTQQESKASEPSVEVRKKKKPKLAPGLSLKKKDVSSMVAKWQKLQEEVRRSYKKLEENVDK